MKNFMQDAEKWNLSGEKHRDQEKMGERYDKQGVSDFAG